MDNISHANQHLMNRSVSSAETTVSSVLMTGAGDIGQTEATCVSDPTSRPSVTGMLGEGMVARGMSLSQRWQLESSCLLAHDGQNVDSACCCTKLTVCYGHMVCVVGWWPGPSAAFSWVLRALPEGAWVSSCSSE